MNLDILVREVPLFPLLFFHNQGHKVRAVKMKIKNLHDFSVSRLFQAGNILPCFSLEEKNGILQPVCAPIYNSEVQGHDTSIILETNVSWVTITCGFVDAVHHCCINNQCYQQPLASCLPNSCSALQTMRLPLSPVLPLFLLVHDFPMIIKQHLLFFFYYIYFYCYFTNFFHAIYFEHIFPSSN